jgi:4-amino-4-deoxychorismate lyase
MSPVDTISLVNGREDRVDPADRGLAYGDGLFETMAAVDGVIGWLDYHLERLELGCRRLAIRPPDAATLRAEITEHCPPRGRCVVKLIVTRGAGARGYGPPADIEPTRILSISSWPSYPAENYSRGIRLRTLELALGENAALAGLKHLNRLEQVLAQMELRHTDAHEGLLRTTSGHVVGGTMSNVFVVRGTELATPRLARAGVAGVMRRVVLEQAGAVGLVATERDLTIADCRAADELFVTNSLLGIWPVARFDSRELAIGVHTASLMRDLGYGAAA